MLATRPVDFRRSAHSLAALAATSLGQDPFDGALIVFQAAYNQNGKAQANQHHSAVEPNQVHMTRPYFQPFASGA